MENQINIIQQLFNEIQYLKRQNYINSQKIDELQIVVKSLYYQNEDSNYFTQNNWENIEMVGNNHKETPATKKIVRSIKCKWFNRGYCRMKSLCEFYHPTNVCKNTKNNEECLNKDCQDKHPKDCKNWLKGIANLMIFANISMI